MSAALLLSLLACAPSAPPLDAPAARHVELTAPTGPEARPQAPPEGKVPRAVCGAEVSRGPHHPALLALGERVGLEHPEAFAGAAASLHDTGALPPCYVSKRDAEARGWSRSRAVWEVLPGGAIGGDHFGNYEGHLPEGRYREADLDDDGGRRGAHRLVFAEDVAGTWRMWVTVDHYATFTDVAAAMGSTP